MKSSKSNSIFSVATKFSLRHPCRKVKRLKADITDLGEAGVHQVLEGLC